QVFDRARRALELAAVEVHRLFHHRVEIGLALALRRLGGRTRLPFRHLHPDRGSKVLYRVDVSHAGVRHQEADRIAVRAAPKAVIELLRGADRERRRLFVVERAQPEVIRAGLFQLHVARHDVDDVDANEKVLLEGFGDQGKKMGTDPILEYVPVFYYPPSLLFTVPETFPMS